MFKSIALSCAVVTGAVFLGSRAAVAADPKASGGQDPVTRRITVLTYNTHLFKDSTAEIGRWVKRKPEPIVFDDVKRRGLIADKITSCGADIVGLQEVWAYKWQDWFKNQLKDTYPYSYRASGTEGRFDLDVDLDIHREALKSSSGLLLLSKYKLKDVQFHPFPDKRTLKEEDQWATKGVLTATVEPWSGGPTFRVGITHANTDVGGVEQPDLRDLARWAGGPLHKGPAVMMGDFNVPRGNIDKYGDGATEMDRLRAIFRSECKDDLNPEGAMDAYRAVHQVNDHTVDWDKNLLAQVFSYSPGGTKALDYVFVKKLGPELTLIPEQAQVLRDWTYDAKVDWWRVHVGDWNSNYVAVQSLQLKGRSHLLAFAAGDHAYIRQIKDSGRGWAEGKEAFSQKWNTNYVPTAVTTFQLNGHPYFFALKAKIPFRQGDEASIYRINDDGKGWTLAWHGKWDSDYVAVRSFYLRGHPYLFCLSKNDRAYIRRINDDGKGWTQTHAGKWDSAYVGTAITAFELNSRPYIFALNRNHRAVIRRVNDGGMGWEDVHAGKWDDHDYVAVQSFVMDGHPHLFGLAANDRGHIRRINDDGKGWTEVQVGGWASNYVPTAITTFSLGERPYVFALKKNDQGWITRLQKSETVKLDLSDHYPVKVAFKVIKEPASRK